MAAPLKTALSSSSTAAAAVSSASAGFVPRAVFEVSSSITRSYFLGHHAGALTAMRRVLSNIGLVLECRDSRVPITSANPLLETSLAGRDRIVVYTKADLCAPPGARWAEKQQRLLRRWHAAGPPLSQSPSSSFLSARERERERGRENEEERDDDDDDENTRALFTAEFDARSVQRLLDAVKARAVAAGSLTGLRALVVGMPNAGKSTLLNALRRVGMRLPGAARTGAQPGVTRKLGTAVRVVAEDADAGLDEGVFVLDTPGVFVPYVSDLESMLKLSLVGCVKDGLVATETLADYLLFRLNLRDPALYAEFSPPTNDVRDFLDAVATRTGKLQKGGVPCREQAADWVVQQYRKGNLGRFALDDVSEASLAAWSRRLAGDGPRETLSLNQARKREKEARKAKSAAKRQAAASGS
ncbi:P-loop containing nucleoside triphosphate hydrolase protein [Biscogniauxia mediterranea]|nr:P-loop containing nucleoside triphosphate hydrolase protein [Biscogniauxia mediterranea]